MQANTTGAVVQLVRISACHAEGREFESRPHRKTLQFKLKSFLFLDLSIFDILQAKRFMHIFTCLKNTLWKTQLQKYGLPLD